MDKRKKEMWDALCELDGETVVRLFTSYHGTARLLDDGFRDFLQEEGYLEPDEEPECCEDCDYCPLDIWMTCPDRGDYPGEEEEEEDDE